MKRGTPMKRTGFARPARPEKLPVELSPAYRPASYAGTTSGVAIVKQPRLECPHLLLMARNVPRPCLILGPSCRLAVADDCCACHGNGAEWNKGTGMKAHDFFTVWGCARCHAWLDSSYTASGQERAAAFRAALDRQIIHWADMARDPIANPKDIEAVDWALGNLILLGYAVEHPTLAVTPTYAS